MAYSHTNSKGVTYYLHSNGKMFYFSKEVKAGALDAVPAGYNYAAISELGRYSALNVRRVQQVYGMNYQFAPNWMMTVTGLYDSYKDRQPYIIDANGRTTGVHAGVSYIF